MRVTFVLALSAAVIGTTYGQMNGGCACGQAQAPAPVYLLGQAPCPQTSNCQPQQQYPLQTICQPVQCPVCQPPTTPRPCIPITTTCQPQTTICTCPPVTCPTPPPAVVCPPPPTVPTCPPPVICPPIPTCPPPVTCQPPTVVTCPPIPTCPPVLTTIPTCATPPPITITCPPVTLPVCNCQQTTQPLCPTPVRQQCAPVQNYGNCCYQCGSSCRRMKLAARRAKKEADFAFNATSGNVTTLCNNIELHEIMRNNMTESVQESKIAVRQEAELKLKSVFAVVCGTGDFSIISDSDMYCQHEVAGVTCFAFRH